MKRSDRDSVLTNFCECDSVGDHDALTLSIKRTSSSRLRLLSSHRLCQTFRQQLENHHVESP